MPKLNSLHKSAISGVAVVFFIALIIIVLASIGIYMVLTAPTSSTTTSSTSTCSGCTTSLPSTTISSSYELLFEQAGVCTPTLYVSGWSVALDHSTTEYQPTNTTFTTAFGAGPQYGIYQNITFTEMAGNYTYFASSPPYINQNGTVVISDANATVTVTDTVSCTLHLSSTTTP